MATRSHRYALLSFALLCIVGSIAAGMLFALHVRPPPPAEEPELTIVDAVGAVGERVGLLTMEAAARAMIERDLRLAALARELGKLVHPPHGMPPLDPDALKRAARVPLSGKLTAADLDEGVFTLDRGAEHGVREGQRYLASRGNDFVALLHVVSVTARSSTARLHEQTKGRGWPPRVGDAVALDDR